MTKRIVIIIPASAQYDAQEWMAQRFGETYRKTFIAGLCAHDDSPNREPTHYIANMQDDEHVIDAMVSHFGAIQGAEVTEGSIRKDKMTRGRKKGRDFIKSKNLRVVIREAGG